MSSAKSNRRVLVVGCGSIGERHARCFQKTGRCSVSFCDPRPERRRQLMEAYGFASAYATLEEALGEPWDAAVVATPAPLHVPQAAELVKHGASVLIEKPLSTGFEGIGDLEQLSADRGAAVGVAYVFRAHPAVREVQRRVRSGEIGPLRLVTAMGGQHFPTFRPDYREIYYSRRETGGGVIQDALTHLADLVQFVAGRYLQVQSDWARQSLPGVEVEDTANVLARLRGPKDESVMATFSCNQFQAPNETRVDLHGELGSLRIDLTGHRWAGLRRGDSDWAWSEPLIHERDELFIRQANHFLDAVDGSSPPLCDLADASHTLRFNIAALEAGQSGNRVRLDEPTP
ncbi:MAG: Gfo/Idh/MocA family protein [Actinomycetota bacterium]